MVEYKTFIKGDIIHTFKVDDKRIYTTVKINDIWVSNPTLTSFYADGWEDYTPPIPELTLPTYAELVEQYIHEHGYPTYGSELAVINNYSIDPIEYEQSYTLYMQTRTAAKEWASKQPHRDE